MSDLDGNIRRVARKIHLIFQKRTFKAFKLVRGRYGLYQMWYN